MSDKQIKMSEGATDKSGAVQTSSYGYPPGYFTAEPLKEIDLKSFFRTVWWGKWIIVAVTIFFAVVSVIYAKSLPDIYQAEAKLAPTEEASGRGMSEMLGQMGGLANLAGLQLGPQQIDKATLAIEIMQSRKFLGDFIERRNILQDLMAVEAWNSQAEEVIYNPEIYDVATDSWVRKTEPNRPQEPTRWEAVEAFRAIYSAERSGAAGLVTLTIDHMSPVVAQTWVNWLIEDINNEMRQRDIDEASRSIEYLNEELTQTSLASMQEGFYRLIEQQTQTMMFASVRPEYIFRVIDPAVVPEQRSRPSRLIIALAGTFLGGVLGVFIVLVIALVRNSSKRVQL